MEFKFSYAKQKRNREQFQQMARIIEQYRAGYGEDGTLLNGDYQWTEADRNDPRQAEDLPLAARLQVDRNTDATYESSWAERKAAMEPPAPPAEEPEEDQWTGPPAYAEEDPALPEDPEYTPVEYMLEELIFLQHAGESVEPVTYYKGTTAIYYKN